MKLLIDYSQIAYGAWFNSEGQFDLWRYMILRIIKKYNKQFLPDEIVLACDAKSWRKRYFKWYKHSRKEKNASLMNDEFFDHYHAFRHELAENFPYKVIKATKAEADDAIAVLAQTKTDVDWIVISSDKDYLQLLANPNVRIYDPNKDIEITFPYDEKSKFKKLFTSPGEFKNYLIMNGDTSDGVPNINSPIDTLYTGERQKNMGTVAIGKIMEQGLENVLQENKSLAERFRQNTNLISLDLKTIPQTIQKRVLKAYAESVVVDDPQKIIDYFVSKSMSSLYEDVGDFTIGCKKVDVKYTVPTGEITDILHPENKITTNVEDLFA